MEGKRVKQKGKNSKKKLIVILLIIIVCMGFILGYKILRKNQEGETIISEIPEEKEEPEKKVQIFQGTDRPFAVMIDNHSDAWPQAGIQKAYMVYEIIAEGGETRLMALFKNADVSEIGPVRSARHYFLDYAMENDAIYTHFGESPQAESDLKRFSINDIDGIAEDGTTFWRTKVKSAPHNALTSMEKLLKSAQNKKYRTTSTEESVLNYVTDEINLENGQDAISVTIPHSNLQTVKYVYNEEKKVYERYARNKIQNDMNTNEVITTKNIIITLCDNYTLNDSENKGRQGINNIGECDGYYITNGKAIKIKCIKKSRNEQPIYQDLEGNIIKVNE